MFQVILEHIDRAEVFVESRKFPQAVLLFVGQVPPVLEQQVLGPAQDGLGFSLGLVQFVQPHSVDDPGIVADHVKLVEDDGYLGGLGLDSCDVGLPHVDGDRFRAAGRYVTKGSESVGAESGGVAELGLCACS